MHRRPPQQAYFLNSYGYVQPCADVTIAAGVAPAPLPPGVQIPSGQSQSNTSRGTTRRGFHFRRQRLHPDDSQTPGCPFQSMCPPGGTAPATGFPKYNILMILCDQMRTPRWLPTAGTSCTGSASDLGALDAILPNLAALRNMSFNFANSYAAATNCTPNRAALLTGLYTPQTCMFVTDDPPKDTTKAYPPALQSYAQGGFATIADVLTRSAGLMNAHATYDCVWLGKWHLSDNPGESQSAFACNPGGNGPADYGFNDVHSIPTPPGGSAAYPWPYPSPNGQDNQGNSGEFQGTSAINPAGTPTSTPPDVPAYGTGSTYPANSYPNPEPAFFLDFPVTFPYGTDYLVAPPAAPPSGYNQLNDAAVAYAFNNWLANVPPPNPPTTPYWFAAVSFVNPHDISQFPYGFGLMSNHAQGANCNPPSSYFCAPPNPAISTSGFEPPGMPAVGVMTPTAFGSVDATPGELEQTHIAPFPYNPPGAPMQCVLYSGSQPPDSLWPGAPSNLSGYNVMWQPTASDIPKNNYGSANPTSKPTLQYQFLTDTTNVAGQIVDRPAGVYDPTGWYTFLNYYFWMQACLDYQIGVVLFSPGDPSSGLQPGLQYAQAGQFWNNTVIIFTSDHGEYGGSHGLHAKGGALYDEAINIPLYVSFPNGTLSGRQASHPPSSNFPTGGIPISFTCSSVDILPFIYSLVLGNESWRCDSSDIINYLKGRESIMDAIMGGSGGAAQRRVASFLQALLVKPMPPSTSCPTGQVYQPYVLHTNDEYYYYNSNSPNMPPHAVAFRTVDATVGGAFSETGPFGGGKLGVYSNWDPNLNPVPGTGVQQFEFYNYESYAALDGGAPGSLALNPGEINNDYWTSGQSNGQAYQYIANFSPATFNSSAPPSVFQTELTQVYQQIQIAHAKAFNLWQLYSFGATPSSHPGINCTNTTTPYFTVSATAVSFAHGGQGMSTVTIQFTNGYGASVTLSCTPPSGVTLLSINPSTVTLPATTSSVTLSAASAGTYYVAIAATGTTSQGTLTQLAVIVLTVS